MHTLQSSACPCNHSHIQQLLTHPSHPSATLPLSPVPLLFTDLLNLHSNKRDKGSWTAFSLSPQLRGNKHTHTQDYSPSFHRDVLYLLFSSSSLLLSQLLLGVRPGLLLTIGSLGKVPIIGIR